MKTKVYVATKISNKEQGISVARELEAIGLEVTSTWLGCEDEERPAIREGPEWHAFCAKWGAIDAADVLRSDVVVVLAVKGCVGTWFEYGLGWGANKKIHYVGNHGMTVFSRLDHTPDGTKVEHHPYVSDLVVALRAEFEGKDESH